MMLAEVYKIPTSLALAIVAGILLISVIASLRTTPPPAVKDA
jgi:hypothetical protein